ncbi:MAG: Transcriptional regulator, HxlR family, partial [uncultured Thermomicrobiales bacterium]
DSNAGWGAPGQRLLGSLQVPGAARRDLEQVVDDGDRRDGGRPAAIRRPAAPARRDLAQGADADAASPGGQGAGDAHGLPVRPLPRRVRADPPWPGRRRAAGCPAGLGRAQGVLRHGECRLRRRGAAGGGRV